MESFKIDTHVHTSEVSHCGKVRACELVKLYAEKKYNALVITDHYHSDYFDSLGNIEWKEKIDCYLTGYRKAKRKGEKLGMQIILGIELRFTESPNDYLVYGMDEDFLYENPELHKMTFEEFYRFRAGKGIAIYQAHPFRKNMTVQESNMLDGIEVLNGNPRHDSNNPLALEHARFNKLRMLGGSDFHQVQDLAGGGIIIEKLPASSKDFAEYILGNNRVTLIGIENLDKSA